MNDYKFWRVMAHDGRLLGPHYATQAEAQAHADEEALNRKGHTFVMEAVSRHGVIVPSVERTDLRYPPQVEAEKP